MKLLVQLQNDRFEGLSYLFKENGSCEFANLPHTFSHKLEALT